MSTNSLIGLLDDEGNVKYIYCHWDGYLENNGQILAEHYTDINKIEELLALGSLSQLGPVIGEKHTFAEHDKFHELEVHPGWCLAYHRDRQEPWNSVKPKICTEQEFWANDNWVYLFSYGNWSFRQPIRQVKYALEDLERNKVPQL
jgi:hypothetical protein